MVRSNPFNAKKKEDDFFVEEWIDFLAERYGWTLPEIMELPIPVFYALIDAINKRNEKERKELEKKR